MMDVWGFPQRVGDVLSLWKSDLIAWPPAVRTVMIVQSSMNSDGSVWASDKRQDIREPPGNGITLMVLQ